MADRESYGGVKKIIDYLKLGNSLRHITPLIEEIQQDVDTQLG